MDVLSTGDAAAIVSEATPPEVVNIEVALVLELLPQEPNQLLLVVLAGYIDLDAFVAKAASWPEALLLPLLD